MAWGNFRRRVGVAGFGAAAALVLIPIAIAASKSINLDGRSANGSESTVALNIIPPTFPATVENKITNRAVGDSYTFNWVSAGPGGFSSRLGTGTTAGVGAKWVWQTAQALYSFTGNSCANDLCFTRVAGPDPVSNTPAWAVPGRTLVQSNVTVSSASLTSSLITFFSPDQLLVTATSSVIPLASGQLAYSTTLANNTSSAVTVEVPPGPLGCCEYSGQLNCEGECVDYLWDEQNCGACGRDCSEVVSCDEYGEPACYWGECYCGEGGEGGEGGYSSPTESSPSVGARRGAEAREAGRRASIARAIPVGAQRLHDVEEAPLCETAGSTVVIPPGGSSTDCHVSGFLAKEIPGVLRVCGGDIPDGEPMCAGGELATEGTFMQLVPDETKPIEPGQAYLTPYQMVVQDSNGDGILQPGETGMLFVTVVNPGDTTYEDPEATLDSPPVDLTNDGDPTEAEVMILQPDSPYDPDVVGVTAAPGAECTGPFPAAQPSTNLIAFEVIVPPGHPGDVIRPFLLNFTGMVDGQPQPIEVPFSLGIGSASADLSVLVEDEPDPVPAGSDVTYSVTVANGGPSDAANVEMSDPLPAGTTFVSVDPPSGWICDAPAVGAAGTVTCRAESLEVGDSATIEVVVRVPGCAGAQELTNAATVSSQAEDDSPEDNTDTATTQVANPGPFVDILQPASDQLGLPSVSIPITIRFATQSAAPIASETVSLESCVLWSGSTTGDRDGLLSDEFLQANKYVLCQAMARCGMTYLYEPRIRVASTDTCGRTGRDSVIIRKRLLKTEVCAR